MDKTAIQSALADITAEADPVLKHLKLASLVSTIPKLERRERTRA